MNIKYFLCAVVWLTVIGIVQAEVVLDGSLGHQGALAGPQFDIRAELGQQVGTNLFHSFETFNLQEQETAVFSGPEQIQNIISRVTGGNQSIINGTIHTKIPQANLYFLNPAGIITGEQATLNVDGSVHLSTADVLHLGKKGQFAATHPQTSLLTTASPTAFGFLSDAPAAVTLKGSQLSVPTKEDNTQANTLSIIGGDIDLQQSQLHAAEGRLNLISVISPGDITLTSTGLAAPHSIQYGRITVAKSALDVSGQGAGSIYIRAGQFKLEDSAISARPQGDKNGEIIDIAVENLEMFNSDISSSTQGSGTGGEIAITANDTITLSGLGYGLFSNTLSEQTEAGDAGTIKVQAKNVHLKEGAEISSATLGSGKGGAIEIEVFEDMTLADALIGASAQSEVDNAGNAGAIVIKARNLTLTEGAQIGNATLGEGQGGRITIDITETASFDGYIVIDDFYFPSGISATAEGIQAPAGKAGDIKFTAKQLKITQGAAISGTTFDGPGQGGEITVDVSDSITLADAVTVTLGGIEASKPSTISSASEGTGDAGEIKITTPLLVLTKGGEISTAATEGQAGQINVHADHIQLSQRSAITSESQGAGEAGNISLTARRIQLAQSKISTQAVGAAGGNITINVPQQLYLIEGAITTSVQGGKGGGGDITI
ncbi:MAG: filamentous hemagglutinin N-terminal domain-containing protein, partial [Pseudomonadota bacterium]|nr:filamentous hemagglutinin N-terminal domain-containing protein [Pseudomonadota bacterium]